MRVWVTGGSSEIGKAIVKSRLDLGDQVVITASTAESLEETLADYKKDNLKVSGVVFSLENPSREEIEKELAKGVDALVLNAATRNIKLRKLDEWKEEDIRKYVQTNIEGNIWLIRQVLETMTEKKFGRMVFISSLSVAQGTSRFPLYCLTKSAIEGLFLNLAVDYGQDNIFFNIVRPGIIATERTKKYWKRSHYLEKVQSIIPAKKLGKAEQVAEALAPLLSSTGYINGAILPVSGGLPMMRSEGLLDL